MVADNYYLVECIAKKIPFSGNLTMKVIMKFFIMGWLWVEDCNNISDRVQKFQKLHRAYGELQVQNILLTIELGNLHNINKNNESEMEQLQSQVGGLTLVRDAKQTERLSLGAKFKEAKRKLEANNDRIAYMYIDLQGSIMSKLHWRDSEKDYS